MQEAELLRSLPVGRTEEARLKLSRGGHSKLQSLGGLPYATCKLALICQKSAIQPVL